MRFCVSSRSSKSSLGPAGEMQLEGDEESVSVPMGAGGAADTLFGDSQQHSDSPRSSSSGS